MSTQIPEGAFTILMTIGLLSGEGHEKAYNKANCGRLRPHLG